MIHSARTLAVLALRFAATAHAAEGDYKTYESARIAKLGESGLRPVVHNVGAETEDHGGGGAAPAAWDRS